MVQHERGHDMNTITNVNDYAVTGKFDIAASFKADKTSTDEKTVTLRVICNNTPLRDVITKALSTVRISWANGPGRSKFESWKHHSIIEVNFGSPGKTMKTHEEIIAELAINFQKAGLPKDKAIELATKAVDNPDLIK